MFWRSFFLRGRLFSPFHLQRFPFWNQGKTWCPEHSEWLNQVLSCIARGMSSYTSWERGGKHYTRMIEWSKWNTTIWSTIWEEMDCLQLHVSLFKRVAFDFSLVWVACKGLSFDRFLYARGRPTALFAFRLFISVTFELVHWVKCKVMNIDVTFVEVNWGL